MPAYFAPVLPISPLTRPLSFELAIAGPETSDKAEDSVVEKARKGRVEQPSAPRSPTAFFLCDHCAPSSSGNRDGTSASEVHADRQPERHRRLSWPVRYQHSLQLHQLQSHHGHAASTTRSSSSSQQPAAASHCIPALDGRSTVRRGVLAWSAFRTVSPAWRSPDHSRFVLSHRTQIDRQLTSRRILSLSRNSQVLQAFSFCPRLERAGPSPFTLCIAPPRGVVNQQPRLRSAQHR